MAGGVIGHGVRLMHISRLWEANILDKRLREKEQQRALVASGKGLGVTIQSTYQKDELVDAVRPAVLAVLDAEIVATIAEIVALGIDVAPKADG